MALLLVVVRGLGGHAPQFHATRDTVLVDERFTLTLDGLKPQQDVTIRVDGIGGVWQPSATFKSFVPSGVGIVTSRGLAAGLRAALRVR